MRFVRAFAAIVVLASAGAASAKLPDPSTSELAITGQTVPCQFRFRADGGLDHLIVDVVLRDAFGLPVPECSASASLLPNGETMAFSCCAPSTQFGVSDAEGAVRFEFDDIAGRGSLDVQITVHCFGPYELFRSAIQFTSPNLVGNGEPPGVLDLGLWAGCLPPAPYCMASDYDCSASVDVLDLGIWAGGLDMGCGVTTAP